MNSGVMQVDVPKRDIEADDSIDRENSKKTKKDPNNEILQQVMELIDASCNENNIARIHLFDVSDPRELHEFAKLNNYLEILDSSHDLQRDREQKNPLYDYYIENLNGLIFINGVIIPLSDDNIDQHLTDIDECRTQNMVKSKMKELIQNSVCNSGFGRLKYTDSDIYPINKKLTDLQIELKKKEKIDITLIETHRGGDPSNNMISDSEYSKVYKSKISTIFDLNTSLSDCMMEVSGIYDILDDDIDNFKLYVKKVKDTFMAETKTFPLLRFYSNYFPNAFSAFIYHNELLNDKYEFINNTIYKILNTYNYYIKDVDFKKQEKIINNYVREIKDSIELNRDFFELKPNNPNPIYILHMFSDDEKDTEVENTNRWTFSIQKGPVTADMVTMELYGIKKRNLSSFISNAFCNTKVKDYTTALRLLSRKMSTTTKNTHVSNGKLIGDGTCILSAILISFYHDNYIALLSSDICCCYRALHNTGFAVRQHPSKLAGTGVGFLSNDRKIEIYKNIEIATFNINQYKDVITGYYYSYENLNNLDIILTSVNSNIFNNINNSYLSKILLPVVIDYYKYFIKNQTIHYLTDYNKKLYDILDPYRLEELENKDTICNLIREIYLCPYIKNSPEEICKNLINDYINELHNLINSISNYVSIGVINIRTVNVDIHIDELIKLVSSIEIKLQTIYPRNDNIINNNTIKQHVVFNLLILFKKEKLGDRPIVNYINKIVDYIAKIPDIKTSLEKKGIIINNYQIIQKYEELYKIFISEYGNVTANDKDKYEKRQIVKQPLNILKYLCRANYLYEKFNKNQNQNQSTIIDYTDNFYKEFLTKYNSATGVIMSIPPTPIRGGGDGDDDDDDDDDDNDDNDDDNDNDKPEGDIFNDGIGNGVGNVETQINDYLSNSLNPETNFAEYINIIPTDNMGTIDKIDIDKIDMDEKENIAYEEYLAENNLNIIINRIEDSPEKESLFRKLNTNMDIISKFVFDNNGNDNIDNNNDNNNDNNDEGIIIGGSSIIKKQKIRKSQKHKKNKKYTIKKD